MLQMFAIYDKKTQTYRAPFFCHHEIEAHRAFIQARDSTNSELSRFPGDFELRYVGVFDESTGQHSLEMARTIEVEG